MKCRIINRSGNELPAYATGSSAGMDLRADIAEPLEIKPLQRAMVPTGIFIALPEGTEAQVRPRSGLAAKYGVTVLNSPGTIDADYRGEVKVILVNLSDTVFIVNPGDRIAQMVIARYEKVEWEACDSLDGTSRGEGGFGSTGM
ncbi:MAG: dUTP diphosphatase [Bacteroidetes bacterium]|uniref:Deoxyuridine 5'-triphosphate nucleotidohydrolase n=1 Tax=Candidatus Merdivivens pullistercoris TaxID=2840873 RepID=A0A9D9I5R2_9BACT|nr:dUTP diphosphatase [Candidatus Merdivivens pullistercoris]